MLLLQLAVGVLFSLCKQTVYRGEILLVEHVGGGGDKYQHFICLRHVQRLAR